MKVPYGVADFHRLRSRGQLYVDRTGYVPVVEELGDSLLFLRPRRFGKSLWLSVLENYYDFRTAKEHEMLFGGLAMGSEPTALAHRFFVMRWDFSKIDPDPPRWGVNANIESRSERIANELRSYLETTIRLFLGTYGEHLPEPLELAEDPFHNFEELLGLIRRTPYRLYLLIDEYDNFANEILVDDEANYKSLVQSDGPFKFLFKWVKSLMAGGGLDRLFITGVSPIVMSDVTSGMNVVENVYLTPELNALCGFTQDNVRDLLEQLYEEKASDAPRWGVGEAEEMVRDWYNGYRFSTIQPVESVYNPTLVLYFLKYLNRYNAYPREMLDTNLAADDGKLDYLARAAEGREAVINLIRQDEPIEVPTLRDRFKISEMLQRSSQDESFLAAYLYYFGMLTLTGETPRRTWLLEPPNAVVRGLFIERIRQLLLPEGSDRSALTKPAWDVLEGKAIEPFLDFIETTLFPSFSNRDARWANELTLKTIFLSLLWNPTSYITFSEPELDRRYPDLCLLRRPDAQSSTLRDLLFEFKRLPLKKLKMSGQEVKNMSRAELMELDSVTEAFSSAEEQLSAYKEALVKRQGDVLKLNAYAVVALGFERLVVQPLQTAGTCIEIITAPAGDQRPGRARDEL